MQGPDMGNTTEDLVHLADCMQVVETSQSLCADVGYDLLG
jgi:hypothetical protein